MSDGNVLKQITAEKNRRIDELIQKFLGHEPHPDERKEFQIINQLGESIVYYQGHLIGSVRYEPVDNNISYDSPEVKFTDGPTE